MQFGMIGINYKNASLSIREKAVFTDTMKMEMYVQLQQHGIDESVILSTCNRSELYFLYIEEAQIECVKQLFIGFFHLIDLTPYIVIKNQSDALMYLFEVSNGLHSLVLGEDQIAGQVVQSETFARDNGQSHKVMNHIFRSAIACTKKAKTLYRISEHPLSLSYVAIKELKKKCDIQGKKALLLGSGKVATLALEYLLTYGIQEVYIATRSVESAKELIQKYAHTTCSIKRIDFVERYQYMDACDFVVSATTSPHAIIQVDKLPEFIHDVYMIDMASPRDIELAVHALPRVHVEDMDTMEKTIASNQEARQEKVAEITSLIHEEIEILVKWMRTIKVDHTIKTIQERIDEVSHEAYMLLNNKLDLNDHEKYIVQKTLHTSMQRLMNDAIVTLKKEEDIQKQEQYHNAMKDLFHIEN